MPAAVSFGTVTGQIMLAVADSADAGPEPDASSAGGSVKFTPSVTQLRVPAANVMLMLQPLTFTLDTNGAFSASLVATDDTDLIPTGWTYHVVFVLNSGARIPAFDMAVPQGVTTDIADVMPV
jgi:hypothetical protein